MSFNPDSHHRHSIRLKGYDYAQAGVYFVTLISKDRACLFGEIVDGLMRFNTLGEIVRAVWLKSADVRREIELDEFIVMPNHLHGIVLIRDLRADIVGAHGRAPVSNRAPESGGAPLQRSPRSLGSFVAGFKSAATTHINQHRRTPGVPVWQRNYYEHIIRNDASLNRNRRYIVDNPLRWALDEENPFTSPP